MFQYHEKARESSAQTPEAEVTEMPKYMTLAAQYGLDDDMDVGASGPGDTNKQTVEQEYQAYITAPLLPKNVNILKFWEVRVILMRHQLLT